MSIDRATSIRAPSLLLFELHDCRNFTTKTTELLVVESQRLRPYRFLVKGFCRMQDGAQSFATQVQARSAYILNFKTPVCSQGTTNPSCTYGARVRLREREREREIERERETEPGKQRLPP